MTCPQCGTSNAQGRRFCAECGTPLASACPTCGAANEPAAKFCGSCGGRLVAGPAGAGVSTSAAEASRPAAVAAERRLVSVLFADLVGFTTLSADRDPEAVRDLLGRYFERSREIIGRYGGTVEKFIGDAVMAVWGAPVAHEDDAERAVRAALDLVDAVPVLGREAGLDLQVRAGVLTGEAAVTIGAVDQGLVAGDLVNTASRLQSVAPPGCVLVGEATRTAAGSAIVFEPAGDQLLRGKPAPVAAWRAVRVVGERGGVRRDDMLEPPFVGRADELRFLKEQFHATGRERRARLVSLVGQAGIGKSRLAWELEKYLDGVVEQVWWHRGRSPSYGEGVTFWALGEMIRRRAGLAEGADEDATRAAVAGMLARHVPDPEERAWIEPRLLVLLGVEAGQTGGREELFAAWRTFFERLSAEGTVALVIEDLQWSDDGLLDFLEHLLDWARTQPIFVLTLGRPELLERRPGWGTDRRGATAMRLDPLSTEAMRELLDGIAPGLPTGVVERVLQRADGIPLYAVETIRMLVTTGRLVPEGGRLVPAGDLLEFEVPATLHALVASRLDALAPDDRALLQDASVLGQSFTLPALSAMSGRSPDDLAPRLASLVRRELLTVETDPRAPTRGQHVFVQALVREVAYGTLSKRERRARHLAAARYFESIGDDELAGAVATHFVSAFRAAPEGEEGAAVAAQARVALLATADRAEALGALGQAADAVRTALEVTPDPATRAGLLVREGQLESLAGRYDEGQRTLEAARLAFEALEDRVGVLTATTWRVLAYLSEGRIAQAFELAAPMQAEAAALEADATAAASVALFSEAMARARFRAHELAEAIAWSDRALALAEPLRLDDVVAMALVTKSSSLVIGGHRREGLALLEGALADARAHGEPVAALRAGVNLASFTTSTDPRGSLARTREGMALARRLGLQGFDGYHASNAMGPAARLGEWAWLRDAIGDLVDPTRHAAGWLEFARDWPDAWTGGGDIARCERLLETSRRDGDYQGELNARAWLMARAFAEGRPAAAVAQGTRLLDYPDFDEWPVAMLGRFALHAGERALAERTLRALQPGPGGACDVDLAMLRAGLAAVDDRTPEAIALYRTALNAYREMGLRLDVALVGLDMAALIGPAEPAARGAAREARDILVELGAAPLVARLDELLAEDAAVRERHPAEATAPAVGP